MKIYHYHRITKIYLGESEAHIDPLETQKQDMNVYLLPAYATFDKPPEVIEGKNIVWDKEWKYEDIPIIPEPEPVPELTTEQRISIAEKSINAYSILTMLLNKGIIKSEDLPKEVTDVLTEISVLKSGG